MLVFSEVAAADRKLRGCQQWGLRRSNCASLGGYRGPASGRELLDRLSTSHLVLES